MIKPLLNELRAKEGTIQKIAFLNEHKQNNVLRDIMMYTFDTSLYQFGITLTTIKDIDVIHTGVMTLNEAIAELNTFILRIKTGHEARDHFVHILSSLTKDDADVFKGIIDRTHHINLGRTNLNKVWKDLLTKQPYCRCASFTLDKEELILKGKKEGQYKIVKGTANNITFPAIVQLKSDGTYRQFKIIEGEVTCTSRSAKPYSYPVLNEQLKNMSNGYVHGELTVILTDELFEIIRPKLEKGDISNETNNVVTIEEAYTESLARGDEYVLPRGIGNGLLNSDNIPSENIRFDVWDFISLEDYQLAAKKDKYNPPKETYDIRFAKLQEQISKLNSNNIRITDYRIVNSLEEASEYVSEKMKLGLEGGILKDWSMLFKDGTSKHALKMKIKFDIDVRITGFIEGKPGTSREETFGAMIFETDDGTIKGSCSGFTKEQLADFNSRRNELIGRVIEIEGNDITRSRSNIHHAISHPVFISLRDKDTTDTFESASNCLDSAKLFKV